VLGLCRAIETFEISLMGLGLGMGMGMGLGLVLGLPEIIFVGFEYFSFGWAGTIINTFYSS
jgi:hypothetical protein